MYSNYTEYGSDNGHWYNRKDIQRLHIGLIIIIAIFILWGLIYIFTYRKYITADITSYYWYRGINIEEWKEVEESDWHVPINGREIRSYRAKYTTERYACGEDEDGDTRYCRRDVYRRKYDYYIDKWVVVTRQEKQGVTQENVTWPNVEDLPYKGTKDNPVYGDKRAGQYISQYTVFFKDKDSNVTYNVDMVETLWFTMKQNRSYKLKLNFFNTVIEIA